MTTLLLAVHLLLGPPSGDQKTLVLVVVGAAGTPEYGKQFEEWADNWKRAAIDAGADFERFGSGDTKGKLTDRDALKQKLVQLSRSTPDEIWLVLIGHGTFDGRKTAKFNLRGPDVPAMQLSQWLEPLDSRLVVINCTSASGPFINALSRPGRVIVTATKSGFQYNFARFGHYISTAIGDPQYDLDKDEQTSLLEAFLAASAHVADFYERDSRLATEHALLDDNGDRLGTPANWFQGIRAVRSATDSAAADGLLANQITLARNSSAQMLPPELLERRNRLEQEVEDLRAEKPNLDEQDYYRQLEVLMLELGGIYRPQSESGEKGIND